MHALVTYYLNDLMTRYPVLEPCYASIEQAYEIWSESYRQGGKALICGNGGSAADAEHIVGELMKSFIRKRPLPAEDVALFERDDPQWGAYLSHHLQGALPTVSLASSTALMTAVSNDVVADMVFAQQVYGLGRPPDVVVGLSTSGASSNVLHALRVANALGLKTIGLTGQSGGFMRECCDCTIAVPALLTPHIQELHIPVYHTLCLMLEETFFGQATL